MIIQKGQFDLRLKEIGGAFELDADVLDAVQVIEFTQHPSIHPEMAYSASLNRSGGDDIADPLRFVRRRTSIRLLDADGDELWAKGTKEDPESV